MPEHLKALVVILILSVMVFTFAHQPARAIAGANGYARRRNLWFGLTLVAFLSYSFWIYALLAIPLLIYAFSRESNTPALFFSVLFVLPVATVLIPGIGQINYIIELSHLRLLELCILLPAFLAMLVRGNIRILSTGPDRLLAAYILLSVALFVRDTTPTDAIRQSLYLFLDVFLPYFVVSRSLNSMQAMRGALLSMVLVLNVLALIGIFEFIKRWSLYYSLLGMLGLSQEYGGIFGAYLPRGDWLRASASAGHPIALGFLMVMGIGLFLYLQRFVGSRFIRRLVLASLAGGLFVTLSRGPWVAMAALMVFFLATGRHPVRRVAGMVLAGAMIFSVIAVIPGGERVINLLPYIGKAEQHTITGRENLVTASIEVIRRHPWFGSVNFRQAPELQVFRVGGIIDVVNSYLGIAMGTGLVGLGLFVGFLGMTLWKIYRAMRFARDANSEERLLGRALFAVLAAIVIMIFMVSSITVIPVTYWSVAGLGVAYVHLMQRQAAGYARA